ncbi:hypothetical protein [Candidatus Amarolinea dominans]|uniref:hypothetical protein n=1 Tax=Candidatus Amarolinea dominans TaxID=3140696 RepID=UPI003135BADF|nr:hypothetical protein [Anaerolineae bacterium]
MPIYTFTLTSPRHQQGPTFEHLALGWLKGVTVVGSGDIAHPGWLREMLTGLNRPKMGFFA